MAYCLEVVSETELWKLEAGWRDLFRHCSYPSPFASWEWASEWWKHFAGDSAIGPLRLLALAVYASDHRLIGLAPFYHPVDSGATLRLRDLRLLGDLGGREEGLTEEPILLLRRGSEGEALDAILAHLRRHRLDGRWDYVNLRVPAWDSPTSPFAGLPASRLQRMQTIALQTLTLADTWEAQRRAFSKSMRDNLSYYPRLLSRRGHEWSIRIARQPSEVASAVSVLIDLHHRRAACTRGIPHTNHLSGAVHQRFLGRSLPLMASEGMAAILLLEVAGAPVAAQSVLENAGTLILYYSGFDPCWYDFSPVTLLCKAAIEDAIERRLTAINFLPVPAGYKTRWGATAGRALHELVYLQPNPLSLTRAVLRRNFGGPRPRIDA